MFFSSSSFRRSRAIKLNNASNYYWQIDIQKQRDKNLISLLWFVLFIALGYLFKFHYLKQIPLDVINKANDDILFFACHKIYMYLIHNSIDFIYIIILYIVSFILYKRSNKKSTHRYTRNIFQTQLLIKFDLFFKGFWIAYGIHFANYIHSISLRNSNLPYVDIFLKTL